VDVGIDPDTAFQIFTDEIDAWWKRGPHNFYNGKRAVAMRFEPGVGGRYLEVYDDATGDVLEIGRITVWEPGRRLAWRMSLDDTEVEVRFEAISAGTRVVLEQRIVSGGKIADFYTGWHNILSWFGDWTDRREGVSQPASPASKDIPALRSNSTSTMTAADAAQGLGLGDSHAAWLTNLDNVHPSASLMAPDQDELAASLTRLGVAPDDAAEVLRTMPSAERNPEAWWLLERSHYVFAGGLANRDIAASTNTSGESVPMLDWAMWSQPPLSPLPAELRFFPVHLILVTVDAIRACHREFGIPDDISWKTLSYLGQAMTVYRKNRGETGIRLTRWDWLRFLGWLYEVGRLQVTHYRIRTHPKEAGPLFWYDDEAIARLGVGFRRGDPALSIHVPASEPLTPDAMDESFHRLRTDFMGIYGREPMRVATCTSWLLDEQLAEYLPQDSNILAFQARFTLVPGAREDEAIIHYVFGCERPKQLDALPQRTALERAIVQHLRLGRSWRMRTGWMDLSN
jgi:hypothetical protein